MIRSRRSQHGFAAVELVAGIALLVLPVVTVVFTVPTWSERQSAARAIAREVARRAVLHGVCDQSEASALGATMARNLGLATATISVGLGCGAGAVLVPGSDLVVAVTVQMPAVHFAAIGDVGAWSWTARHRMPVDSYVSVP